MNSTTSTGMLSLEKGLKKSCRQALGLVVASIQFVGQHELGSQVCLTCTVG